MSKQPFYKAHWRNISTERMDAYRAAFAWDAATEAMYAPAGIAPGQVAIDFGCGPGKVAVELARRVGVKGHVHALDINAAFLDTTLVNAEAAGLAPHVTTHLTDGVTLPMADASVDIATARNAIMYVDDPVATLSEFRRVLKPGGRALAIDGDWHMMVAEPVPRDLWRDFVLAAGHACRHADMGRKLYASFTAAGFRDVEVTIHAKADTTGTKLGMIRNMAAYARESGDMEPNRIDEVLHSLEAALNGDRYLVTSPQFAVVGRAG